MKKIAIHVLLFAYTACAMEGPSSGADQSAIATDELAKDNVQGTTVPESNAQQTQDLVDALSQNKLKEAIIAVRNGADVNVAIPLDAIIDSASSSSNSILLQNPLHWAIAFLEAAHSNTGALLFSMAPDYEQIIRTDVTTLIKELIGHGADVNIKDSLGQTPLKLALRAGDFSITLLIIEKGVATAELTDQELKKLTNNLLEYLQEKTSAEPTLSKKTLETIKSILTRTLFSSIMYGDQQTAELVITNDYALELNLNLEGALNFVNKKLSAPVEKRKQCKAIQTSLNQAIELRKTHITGQNLPLLLSEVPQLLRKKNCRDAIQHIQDVLAKSHTTD